LKLYSDAMDTMIPVGARPAARILLLDEENRLLLLQAQDSPGEHRWWLAPGGGLKPGESFEAAAQRELHEETGRALPIGRWVWTRRHIYDWQGRRHDQYERFFVVRAAAQPMIAPVKADGYVIAHRWWHLGEIERSDEDFAPRRLALLLPSIICGAYPDPPIDCGI
jgi:8-oxo-dGTP pyrophosphatase MutT (NUDIX family)